MAVAYNEGLAVAIGGIATNPLKGTLALDNSLSDGSSLSFTARGARGDLAHVQRGATASVTDTASGTTLFTGHLLGAKGTSHGGDGGLIDVKVVAAGIEQQLYRHTLLAADARAVNVADDADAQLDELVGVAGTAYSAGSVDANVNALAGVGPGESVGALLRGMGDVQRVEPTGVIDLLTRSGLASSDTLGEGDFKKTSRYTVELETEVGRVIANGAPVKFIATGTLSRIVEGGVAMAVATVTPPADTEIKSVEGVVARQDLTGKFDAGDALDGVWDPDKNRFEWSGVLASGESSLIEMRGVWRTEDSVSASGASALAGDLAIDVPVTGATAIRAAANLALDRRRQPVELMVLDLVFGADVDILSPGDAVECTLALQQQLDVHQPNAADLWLVHGRRLTQPGSAQAEVSLRLSRRLPDFRDRDFWGQERGEGSGGRQIVIGGGSGAPQIAQVIPAQTVVVGGDDVEIDLGEYFSDPDGDLLTYVAVSSDTSLATVSVSGDALTISPVAEGSLSVTVTASDATRSTAQIVSVSVVTNRAPVVDATVAEQSVLFETVIDLADHFSDPDGDDLEYTSSSDNTNRMTVAVTDSMLTLTAGDEDGDVTITVTASDGQESVSSMFTATAIPKLGPIVIGASSGFASSLFIRWTYDAGSRIELGAAGSSSLFADQTTDYFLLGITLRAGTGLFRMSLARSQTESDSDVTGPDFSTSWENGGAGAIVITLAGVDYRFEAPNGPNVNSTDMTEPYTWSFASGAADIATAASLATAYDAATAAQRDATTVVFALPA